MKLITSSLLFGALCLAVPALAASGPAGHSHDDTAFGQPGDPSKPARVINVSMKETEDGKMLFVPAKIDVRLGEQVRFTARNNGGLDHEIVIGTLEANLKHGEEMKKNPDMEHSDPNAARVQPKKTSDIVWKFTKAGEFDFSCLIPGHREAGMFGTIVVK